LTTINNINQGPSKKGGNVKVALFLAFFLLSGCASNAPVARVAPTAASDSVASVVVPPSSDLRPQNGESRSSLTNNNLRPYQRQFRAGLAAIANKEWLEASGNLDLAMNELIAESDDSTSMLDSVGYAREIQAIMQAMEGVYPHLSGLGVMDSAVSFLEEATPLEELEDEQPLNLAEFSELAKVLDTMDLKQFSLPVVFNERVLREIHFLSKAVPKFSNTAISRMPRYENMIREKLRARNMPEDLLYLCFVESGFKVKAYSPAKASGLWQFIPGTGIRYGLQVNTWMDQRRDPELATNAALDYLQNLHSEFNDWLLAMAAYNCGEGRIRRMIRSDKTMTYWDLNLPRETMHYVPRILAASVVGRNPEAYGLLRQESDEVYLPFDTVTVDEGVPLQNIAEGAGSSLSTLRELNPELLRWMTPPHMKQCLIRIPEGTRDRFVEAYTQMDRSKFCRWTEHKVKGSQTLAYIARKYGVKAAEIREINGLKKDRLRRGQILMIPVTLAAHNTTEVAASKGSKAKAGQYTVRKGDNLKAIARRFGTSVTDLKKWNDLEDGKIKVGMVLHVNPTPQATRKEAAVPETHEYKVKSGDSYYVISQELGVSMDDLMTLNPDVENSKLQVGQSIHVPATANDDDSSSPNVVSNTKSVKSGKATPKKGKESAAKDEDEKPVEVHVVTSGDNLSAIARHYQISLSDIQDWNKIDSKAGLKLGQRIRVRAPAAKVVFHVVAKGETLWDLARQYGVSVQQILNWNSISSGKVQAGIRLKVGG